MLSCFNDVGNLPQQSSTQFANKPVRWRFTQGTSFPAPARQVGQVVSQPQRFFRAQNTAIPLADDKTAGPTTKLTYLGFEIDTQDMVIRIPQHKVDSLIQLVSDFLSRKKVTLKELQSLVGMLNFFQ